MSSTDTHVGTRSRRTPWTHALSPLLAVLVSGVVAAAVLGALSVTTAVEVLLGHAGPTPRPRPSSAAAEDAPQLGGFWVVQTEDLDGALDLAQRGAVACQGDVELRPFQDG